MSTNSPIEGSFEELQFFGGNNYPKGLHWYAEQFAKISKSTASVIFEKSANYFDSDDAPRALSALLPNAKLIVILMDPVDRAYSWYQVILLFIKFHSLVTEFVIACECSQRFHH